jgi:LysM repeat protein
LFDYGNWFLGYYPPKATDNILHKGFQPYYLNIQNHSNQSITFNSNVQVNFFTGKYFHKKTKHEQWLIFGVSTGISAALSLIQPEMFLPFFGTLFVGYTLPNLFYNMGVNGKHKNFVTNLSPESISILPGKTDSLVVFANPTDKLLYFKLRKSKEGSFIDIPITPSNYRSRFFKFNGLNAMVMRPGDSLKEIGLKLDIPHQYLLSFNDLNAEDNIAIGDTFYLEPKRKYAIQNQHIIKEGESIYSISQKYGVNKESLYLLNKDLKLDNLTPGQVIRLNRKKIVAK